MPTPHNKQELRERVIKEFDEKFPKLWHGHPDIILAKDLTACTDEVKDFLFSTLTARDEYWLGKIKEAIGEDNVPSGINAIPETTEYAMGWNDCRKEAFEKVNSFRQSLRTALLSPQEGVECTKDSNCPVHYGECK